MKTGKCCGALAVALVFAASAGAQTVWNGLYDDTITFKTGTAFTIRTPGQLAKLAKLVNDGSLATNALTFTLANDIALNVTTENQDWKRNPPENRWTAIGTRERPFQGTFNGAGFVVRGVYINTDADYQGFFGCVKKGAAARGAIQKLRIDESYVKGGGYVGGLVGSDSGTITDCYSTAVVEGSGSNVGGLAGFMSRGVISNSYATGNVSGLDSVGGLVGAGVLDSIKGGYATGDVDGRGDYVGGLVGYSSGYIINASATGTVAAAGSYAGGLVGSSSSVVANSYAIGKVSGRSYVGGLVGRKIGAAIKNCYAAGEIPEAGNFVGGLVGGVLDGATITCGYYDSDAAAGVRGPGIPKSSIKMQSRDFTGLLNVAAYALKTNAYKEGANRWIYSTGLYPRVSIEPVTVADFAACFAGGNGKPDSAYMIDTAQHLENLAVYVNCGADLGAGAVNFKLKRDIVLNDTAGWREWEKKPPAYEWTAIGQQPRDTVGQPKVRFNGTFDGGGFAVVGVYINKGDDTTFAGRYQGLFGRVEQGGVIKNVGVEKSYINGYCYVGGLAGWSSKGTIIKSYTKNMRVEASGGVNGAGGIGGLVGMDSAGTIINSYSAADVSGFINMAGGLVGWNTNSKISYCSATGNVSVTGDDVGGLVGRNDSSSVIKDSYAAGTVSGVGNVVGGLVGLNIDASITRGYAVGNVDGNSSVGGLVGLKLGTRAIESCFYRDDALRVHNDFGTPADTVRLREESTYAGWNFTTIWAMDDESRSYPYLGMTRAAKPVITKQPPVGDSVGVGAKLTLSVEARSTDGGKLTYQWYSNEIPANTDGVKIEGAEGASYVVPTGEEARIHYYVVVTNTMTASVADSLAGQKTASIASNPVRVKVGVPVDAVALVDRVVPITDSNKETASILPVPALTSELTVGPNPVSGGAVTLFHKGNRIIKSDLWVYDATGKIVNEFRIGGGIGWDLKDRKGRRVSEGTYLVRGVVIGVDGKRERVSVVVGVK